MSYLFHNEQEKSLIESFKDRGYLIFDIDNVEILHTIRKRIFDWAKTSIKLPADLPEREFFEQTHRYVPISELNQFRLKVIQMLGSVSDFRFELFKLAERQIYTLVGNELAMQRSINLSIQLPQDESSLLGIHSDVWSGNSPYEIVFWLPLVNVRKTQSMYVVSKERTQDVMDNFEKYSHMSSEALFEDVKPDSTWLELKFGQGLLFSHILLHGNVVNEESVSRWTFNTRFKALMAPYGMKALGENFLPILIRPISEFGANYVKPTRFARKDSHE